MVASELDEVKGVGPKTKEELFRRFGGVESIRAASLNDLTETVGKSKGLLVFGYFHPNESSDLKE